MDTDKPIRKAIVRNVATQRQLEAYLPSNYRVTAEVDDLSWPDHLVFEIEGRDVAGWTLDDYVIPRLASGLIWAEELK
jgi:hypothetical protein